MAKKRKKTDFSEQDARREQLRAYLARTDEERRQRVEREATEEKKSLGLVLGRRLVLGEPALQDARESTPTSRPPSSTGTRSTSCSSRKRNASSSGSVGVDRDVRRLGDRRRSVVERGSRPAATTSRTSVLRVTTPTSAPSSSTTKTARTSGRVEQPRRLLRGRARRRAAAGRTTIASRHDLLITDRARGPRARPRPRGSPATSAAVRSVTPAPRETSQTRSKASPILSASLARISSRPQKRRPRSCTHSKYETVTPPAFVRMSGSDRDAALGEDRVGLERGRAVRALGDHARLDARRVLARHLILARGEDEDVAGQLEQLLVRHRARVGQPSSEPCSAAYALQLRACRARPRRGRRRRRPRRAITVAPRSAARARRRRRRCRSPGRRSAARRGSSRAARRRAR